MDDHRVKLEGRDENECKIVITNTKLEDDGIWNFTILLGNNGFVGRHEHTAFVVVLTTIQDTFLYNTGSLN